MDVRNSKNIPYDAHGTRPWSNDLFTCLEDPITFIVAWFAPCAIYGKNKTRREALEQHGRPHPEGGEIAGSDTITYAALQCCCGLGWIVGMSNREQSRNRYKVAGDGATDCFLSCCCAPCALTQESREIELEEQALGGHGGGFTTQTQKK